MRPGAATVARAGAHGDGVPPACVGVVFDACGGARRLAAGERIALCAGERAFCFHPGPYQADLTPFASAPELGLRIDFVIDAPDPRVARQRFDLFLMSEVAGRLDSADLCAAIETALRRELMQGGLTLPSCTTLEEWHAFRAGFNRLLYTRFGLTVDDCVPVDLGAALDYAEILLARVAAPPVDAADVFEADVLKSGVLKAEVFKAEVFKADVFKAEVSNTPDTPDAPDIVDAGKALAKADAADARSAAPADASAAVESVVNAVVDAAADARALRRLFLELPCLMHGLRQATPPTGRGLFRAQQLLLQRLDLVCLSVETMPALALKAPGQALALCQQLRRVSHSVRAATALDEGWALLARLDEAPSARLAALFDDADRIVANLEHDCAARRTVASADEPA